MHTVHYADGLSKRRLEEKEETDDAEDKPITLIASALGIMFDVNDYDPSVTGEEKKVIDAFFDSLGFEADPPSSDKL